jgi:hypothetical protein
MEIQRRWESQFTINKSIPVTSKPPMLYRYENKNHVEQFFDDGTLKISTFKNYRSYEDNELGDKFEGHPYMIHDLPDNKQEGAVLIVGNNSYSFAVSTQLNKVLMKTFTRNWVFNIFDPINFMIEVEKQLTHVERILHGNCIYVKDGMFRDKRNAPFQGFLEYEGYFLKRLKYSPQCEYRMIWSTLHQANNDLYLKVPEARKYCRFIDEADFEDLNDENLEKKG